MGDEVTIDVDPDARPSDAPTLDDLLIGAGFQPLHTVGPPRARRVLSLPDTLGQGMRVLTCGLNPAIYAAERGVGFARGSNRFWKAVLAAGLASVERDPRHAFDVHGLGMTDLCKRATVASSEVNADEYSEGARRVEALVRWLRPRVVAFVGLEGWRAAVDRGAAPGLQDRTFGGRPAYVLPSTSGLNAHVRLDDLVAHFREVARLAQ
ncbi:MAG TPA: mismatch-specific DNA-glycosylase [Acidimicrobiales bacterium]|nr:mismatch-specific DNA-glycosylase [Acidimicrobiales bacterium]